MRIAKNSFQGGNVRKGLKESISVVNRSIFPGIGARNPRRNVETKRVERITTYLRMFRSFMLQPYRKFHLPSSAKFGSRPPCLLLITPKKYIDV